MTSICRVLSATSLLIGSVAFGSERPAEVMIVATMHGLHRDHRGFDYDDLFRLVESFEPDLVGVEIRPEDMDADEDYLRANYPHEMIELARRYGDSAFGFDWLGDEIANRPIPVGYWQERSPIKSLERELASDAGIAETEEELRKRLRGTKYQQLSDFYARRDREIGQRLVEVVRENPGRRIIALTGADHRGPVEQKLRNALGAEVLIVPVGGQ